MRILNSDLLCSCCEAAEQLSTPAPAVPYASTAGLEAVYRLGWGWSGERISAVPFDMYHW